MDSQGVSQATGSRETGVNLNAHVTGDPIRHVTAGGTVTVGHTVLIVVAILLLLWVLGIGPLKSVRM